MGGVAECWVHASLEAALSLSGFRRLLIGDTPRAYVKAATDIRGVKSFEDDLLHG